MAVELEVKLTLTEANLVRATSWLAVQDGVEALGTRTLRNCYYDTPDGSLNERRIALRLRQQDDQFIQTLKTKGEFSAGAHRRNEWEWSLPEAALNTDLLADTPLADDAALRELQPVFETNFERQIFMIHRNGTSIEVAVDNGAILAGDQVRPLHEVEFELKSGEPEQLLLCALELAEAVPVLLNLVSKAEQGYLLAGQYRPEIPVAGDEGGPVSVNGWLSGLSIAWLRAVDYPIAQVDLSAVEAKADSLGLASQFESVNSELSRGIPVAAVAAEPNLGLLQIQLAGG